jgi:uncharacterized protein involved in response to NO
MGSALLSRGFRPFFLGAALWAVLAIGLWPFEFDGAIEIPTAFSPVDWHAHEMIFGYVAAVVAGFLMTAIPNWTGRLPVSGWPLAGLAGLWAAGRLAVFESARIGRPLASLVDCAFLAVFAAVVAREVLAGKNWRNAKIVALIALLAFVNLYFHCEDATESVADIAQRAALGLIVMLILLVGGRVTPSFTSSALGRQGVAKRPAAFTKLDGAVMLVSGLALAAWVFAPDAGWTGALAFAAGIGNLWRLSRWRGLAVRRDALLLVLHLGFGLAATGFLVCGFHALSPRYVPYEVSVHVWAIGGAGVMTLAMMTRATLGHSGRSLVASTATKAAFVFIVIALLTRVALAFLPASQTLLLHGAACAWIAAFVAFLLGYAPLLTRGPKLGE